MNSNLNKARTAKNDEFYTNLNDIELELKHYIKHFKGKTVFCNCDDPTASNFWKYFTMQFNVFGLKKLISTHYNRGGTSYKLEATADQSGNIVIEKTDLLEDGDFRSEEAIKSLKESDIVVTNPPFSLFREYIAQLIQNEKQFLIIGSQNAITYKEVFPLLKENKVWLGNNSPKSFVQPDGSVKKFGNILWFTNLTHQKRNTFLFLQESYNSKNYPEYDNYKAIEVGENAKIPKDYFSEMGVPITFMSHYCPNQFEIIGIMDRANSSGLKTKIYTKKDHPKYSDLNARGVIKINNEYIAKYARVIIKRK